MSKIKNSSEFKNALVYAGKSLTVMSGMAGLASSPVLLVSDKAFIGAFFISTAVMGFGAIANNHGFDSYVKIFDKMFAIKDKGR